MINKFYIPYTGGKMKENKYYEHLFKDFKFKNIIEPFAGSFSFIRHYYNLNSEDKSIKYVINDLDVDLIGFLNDIKKSRLGFRKYLNYMIKHYNDGKITKEKYEQMKKKKTLLNYVFLNKVYQIRPGLFPITRKIKFLNYEDYIELDLFIKKKVEINNKDYKEIIDKYINDENALIFLDPPYFLSNGNILYSNKGLGFNGNSNSKNYNDSTIEYINILNYLRNAKCLIIFIINKSSLIEYLYKDFIVGEYDVQYQITKKFNKHLIISNYNYYKNNCNKNT